MLDIISIDLGGGALLIDLDAVREWTKTMRWGDMAPNVYFFGMLKVHRIIGIGTPFP